jgi:hypothetical protein
MIALVKVVKTALNQLLEGSTLLSLRMNDISNPIDPTDPTNFTSHTHPTNPYQYILYP